MAEPAATTGQAVTADSTGTTAAAPQGSEGQSAARAQTTSTGPESGTESFFDPKSIEDKPELLSAYKQMQASYTKKSQKFKDLQKKIDAFEAYERDPQGTVKQLAAQYGYNLVQRDPKGEQDDNPKTWADVYAKAKKEVLKELEPMLGQVRELKQQNVEQYLDNKFTDWRTYEDDMLGLLQKHPSLATDPDKLYRLAVPEEVWEARATKAAMAKLKNTSDNGAISGASTTSKQTANEPTGPLTFQQAVEVAKARLGKQGIRP